MSVYVNPKIRRPCNNDGTHQIQIKIRVPDCDFQEDFPVKYKLNDRLINLKLRENDWKNKSEYHKRLIKNSRFRYREIVNYILDHKLDLTRNTIKKLYSKNVFDVKEEELVERIKTLLAYSYTNEFIEENYSNEFILEFTKSFVQSEEELSEEDLANELVNYEPQHVIQKKIAELKAISDPYERCEQQYNTKGFANYNRIIDVFGYYWTLKRINTGRFINKYDQKLILRIADYIFNSGASDSISDLDEKWIADYFIYLRDKGYIDTRKIRRYTPLEMYDYQATLIGANSQRKFYTESSFKNQIKVFKRYFKKIKKHTGLLKKAKKIKLKKFTFDSIKTLGANYADNYTQKDHYVNRNELIALSKYSSTKVDHNKVRDLFFIQVFTSGNRSIDKDIVEFKKIENKDYVTVHHSKTGKANKSGIFKPLREVIINNDNQFPQISINTTDYNRILKEIAKELNLNREIEFVENKVNTTRTQYSYKKLYDCISQYFSRHTLVNYLVDSGTPDEEIIKITGHVNPEILNHYKRKLTIADKQRIIDEADKISWH